MRRVGRGSATLGAAIAGGALFSPASASAHALVGRQDLPVPEWLFAWGASLVLIVSFVALSALWAKPRLEGDEWRPVRSGFLQAAVSGPVSLVTGAIGVALLVITIWAGLEGTEAPDRNFALTFVFVTVWTGVPFFSTFIGDFFRAFNPWAAIARTTAAGFRLIAGRPAPPALAYPERLGRWPAAAGLLLFLWLELVYGQSGFQTVGLTPHTVAIATLAYTAYTFVGMALFGIDKWLERGEFLSVYFGMFSTLAPLEVRGGQLGRRPWLSGATKWAAAIPGSVALVLITIGGTTYDGAQEGTLQQPIADLFDVVRDVGLGPVAALRVSNSIFLAATIGLVFGIYWAGVRGMQSVQGSPPLGKLGQALAHSFIPIGLAYLVAHYFSLFIFQEQAQFTYLLSDPLGDGSDLFGTAGSGIDYGVIGSETIWYVQVAALVIGHVTALVLGHDRALALYDDTRRATRSQYWMLALMVGFTSLGLFLLSQANG